MLATMRNQCRMSAIWANRAGFAARLALDLADFRFLDALRLLKPQQSVTNHIQIRERASDEQSVRVFGEAAVAHLGKAKHALEHPDRMLTLGAHSGLGPILLPLDLIDHAPVTVAPMGEVFRAWRRGADRLALASIGLVSPDPGLLPVQQLGQHLRVSHVRRCGRDRVNKLELTVHSEMRLHAK